MNNQLINTDVEIRETLNKMKIRAPKRYKVLQAMIEGKKDQEIAAEFGIDQAVVRTHISLICKKLGIEGKTSSKRSILMSKLSGYYNSENRIVERRELELEVKESIEKPGSITRIKSPQRMGKTTIIQRVINEIKSPNYKIIELNFKLLLSQDYTSFLQYFASIVGNNLEIENKLEEYWDEKVTPNYNITEYFEKYLLTKIGIDKSLILILDNVDVIFNQNEFDENFDWKMDFCWLMRGWYDNAQENINNDNLWRKLRLVLIHSTDNYVALDIGKSPLANIGAIEIPEFSESEMQQLVQVYQLKWKSEQVRKLINLVGGNPFLVNTLLNQISSNKIELETLDTQKLTEIFENYLSQYLLILEQIPTLKQSFRKIIQSSEIPMQIKDLKTVFQLESLGLIKQEKEGWITRCQFYLDYFKGYFDNKQGSK